MIEMLLVIALVVMAVANRNRMRRVEARLAVLERRLAEGQVSIAPEVTAAGGAEPAAPVTPAELTPDATATPEPEPVLSEATPQPSETPSQPAATPPAISFEERFGTQWVVWVGGLALALGGIFLVRYSIEQDLIGPGVRVVLGALLAAGLIAAGEWTRRKETLAGLPGLPAVSIPAILTAAGTMTAYADVYAAYELYGFLSSGAAFILLGLVALATLAAALLHGPALAGLGLVGAYVTPLLIASDDPNYWALYLYLAVVTAAAFALARMRMWRWLAITAVVFCVFWVLPGLGEVKFDTLAAQSFHIIVGFALVALIVVAGLLFGPDAIPGRIDSMSSAALGAYLFAAALIVIFSGHEPLPLGLFAALTAATVAIAWRTDAAAAALPAGALLVALVFASWAVSFGIETLIAPSGPTAGAIPEPSTVAYTMHLLLGAGFAALFGIVGFMAQGRSGQPLIPMLWSACATFVPVAILAALYYRIANFEASIPFAAIGLVLAGIFAFAVEQLTKREPRPGLAGSEAIFATGAVAALALAFTMALSKGWLTIALAVIVPGIAWICEKRPLPALRWLAAVMVVLVVLRIGWEPRIVGDTVGTTPIFNWLLYGYGVPAAAFWLAGYMLRKRADDVPARMIDSGAILFTVLLAVWEIRHLVNGGDVYKQTAPLAEIALQVCVGLAMVIGLERLRERTASIVHNVGALVIAVLTLAAIVFGLGIAVNPFVTGDPVGGPVINLILLGYGLPALLAGVLALMTRGIRPQAYSTTAAIVAVGLALSYLTLQVTRFYHGPVLTAGPTTDAEQYAYSAVWLVFGVLLLVAGFVLRSRSVRFASAAVVGLTVAKVFLWDMSDLTGIYRALSFIGLGIVLMGIGWLYQRLLFPRVPAAVQAPAGGTPPGETPPPG